MCVNELPNHLHRRGQLRCCSSSPLRGKPLLDTHLGLSPPSSTCRSLTRARCALLEPYRILQDLSGVSQKDYTHVPQEPD